MLGLCAAAALALPPQVDNTVVGTFRGASVELRGRHFGVPGAGSELVVGSGAHTRLVPSGHPAIDVWTDERIVVELPPGAPSGRLRVHTPDGVSAEVRVDVYDYTAFDIPPTPGTNAHPLSIDVDPSGRVWVNQEFHLELQLLDPLVGLVAGLAIPKPPPPGPFASTIFGDHRTQTSILGEDVLVDPLGRVWFTQGGASLYSGAHPNHSRVVCVLPDAAGGPEFRVYNVPGDWNEVIGLAWDAGRGWIWFANGGLDSGAKLVGFDPELLPWDNTFAFDTSLDGQVCGVGSPSDPCYHTYVLPNPTGHPSHMVVDDAGDIWFTAYWGRSIGRLDPATGAVDSYPVPATISTAGPAVFVGAGPWEIVRLPGGDLVFGEFFDGTLTRFDAARASDPACRALDVSGRNPCMQDRVMPLYDAADDRLHSLALGLDGKLWFTIHTEDVPGRGGSVGYLTGDGRMTRFPPLGDFPGTGAGTADGIAIDPVTGDVWFAEFWRKRVGRLVYVPEL